ncbi:hypothetical protein SLS58_005128 [Diplodia intermedia]|uniref:Uncharacterized protein n=1 Tax=Diplodia intermedia TaxID=856260 RepID=A0ABR3TS04_9PEZI
MSQPTLTSTQPTHANWVRAAETTLERLQADIDRVHRRILANAADRITLGSDDSASSHQAPTCNLDEALTRERIHEINGRIMQLLQQVWYVELHGLFDEHMKSVGLKIMVAMHDWKVLKDSIGESAVAEDDREVSIVEEE